MWFNIKIGIWFAVLILGLFLLSTAILATYIPSFFTLPWLDPVSLIAIDPVMLAIAIGVMFGIGIAGAYVFNKGEAALK